MSDLRPTNPIYLIWAGVYYVLRSRIFWGVVVLLLILFFWRGREENVDIAEQEQLYEQAIELEIDRLIAEGKAQASSNPKTAGAKDSQAKEQPEFFFTPMLCEAIATRSYQKLGRMPTNWTDIVSSGVTKKIPPARKGFKYVYDPKLGTIDEVPVKDTKATK